MAILACLAISYAAQATAVNVATSIETSRVAGRAPEAAPSIRGTAEPGKPLIGASGFSDADDDIESGTTYTWSGGGVTDANASEQTLVLPVAAGANTITLTVTPKTDATSTDPAVGEEQTVEIDIPASLGAFLKPNTTLWTWDDANTYCAGLGGGARLPTLAELKSVYLSAPSAVKQGEYNEEMCDEHGWPLSGWCGGGSDNYWSNSPNGAGGYYVVVMNDGGYTNIVGNYIHAACVRP